MQTFIKKPVAVKGYQLTHQLAQDIFDNKIECPAGLTPLCSSAFEGKILTFGCTVVTIHGQKTCVVIGDWIMDEGDGIHFYPIKPDIFKKTYFTEQEYAELGPT